MSSTLFRFEKRLRTCLLIAACLVWAPEVSADVVGFPADDCPVGAVGETCHGGDYCAPDLCTTAGDCDDGQECLIRQACIGQIDCAGGWGGPFYESTFEGLCPGGSCGDGESCETIRVCVDDNLEGGCACRVGARDQGLAPLFGVLVVGVALALRLRRRRG